MDKTDTEETLVKLEQDGVKNASIVELHMPAYEKFLQQATKTHGKIWQGETPEPQPEFMQAGIIGLLIMNSVSSLILHQQRFQLHYCH